MYINNQEKLERNWETERRPTAAVPWTDYKNSRPIEDMRSWQKSIGNICGIFGNLIEFNWNTYDLISKSVEYKRLGFEKIVRPSEISDLLWNKAEVIVISYIGDSKVIIKSEGEFLPEWYKDLEATVY